MTSVAAPVTTLPCVPTLSHHVTFDDSQAFGRLSPIPVPAGATGRASPMDVTLRADGSGNVTDQISMYMILDGLRSEAVQDSAPAAFPHRREASPANWG